MTAYTEEPVLSEAKSACTAVPVNLGETGLDVGIGTTCLRKPCPTSDLPPLKWSSLKYVLTMEDEINGEEAAYS